VYTETNKNMKAKTVKTSSSTVAERPRDASVCLVGFNSTISRAQSYIIEKLYSP